MAYDAAGHILADLVGNTLVVGDIQISQGTPGTGATGQSILNGSFTSEILTGSQRVLSGLSATTHGVATPGIQVFSATGPGIYWGLSTPTFSAATGSLYINTDSGSITATTALYINTTGVSTWVAIL